MEAGIGLLCAFLINFIILALLDKKDRNKIQGSSDILYNSSNTDNTIYNSELSVFETLEKANITVNFLRGDM